MGDRGATSYAYTGETTEWEVSSDGVGLLASVMGCRLNAGMNAKDLATARTPHHDRGAEL